MHDDSALMQRVRSRDPAAFESLYDRHHRLVYGIALRMLEQAPAAEDATQAIFLKVWSAPDAFESGNFQAWLARVSRNHCLDFLRAQSRQQRRTVPEPQLATPAEDLALSNLDAKRVYNALQHLPPEQRQLIELAFFGGLTQQSVALRTKLPLGTVKTRIRTGLQRLRTLMETGVPA